MPRKALRCLVELNIHAVTAPGVWLPRRDDVYLSISLFGQNRHTQLTSPGFPLLFHERFRFDKVFYTAYEPSQVADSLNDQYVLIELVQLSDISNKGRLLARYEATAREFLYPYPSYSTDYGTEDREVLLQRSIDFPGIAPKLEFNTKTVIKETSTVIDLYSDSPHIRNYEDDLQITRKSRSRQAHTGRRSRSRGRSASPRNTSTYQRQTLSSASHSRPGSLERELEKLSLDFRDYPSHSDDDRPPFVVRKVEKNLIHRTPGKISKKALILQRRRSKSAGRSRSKSPRRPSGYSSALEGSYSNCRPWYTTYSKQPLNYSYRMYESDTDDALNDYDLKVGNVYPASTSAGYRARSPSPRRYRSSLRDRFDDTYYSPSDRISTKVDYALKRNKSLDRLNGHSSLYDGYYLSRPYSPYRMYRSWSPYRYWDYRYLDTDTDSVDDLALDLDLARYRSMVHIHDGEYWTEKAAAYQGKSHRDVFNSTLQKLYAEMFNEYKSSKSHTT